MEYYPHKLSVAAPTKREGCKTHLLSQSINLLRLQPGVAKHSNLARDMVPIMLRAELFETALECIPHRNDTIRYSLDFGEPLIVELWVIEDLRCDASTTDGGVGVEGSDEDLDLRVEALLLFGGFREEGEGPNTFAIESLRGRLVYQEKTGGRMRTYHVLGEGLAQGDLVALLNEVADGVGIFVSVTGCEPLVRHVKEGKMAAVLHGIANDPPLFGCRVDTGRVVRTGVEEEDGALGGIFDVHEETVDVETDSLLIVVPVLLHV